MDSPFSAPASASASGYPQPLTVNPSLSTPHPQPLTVKPSPSTPHLDRRAQLKEYKSKVAAMKDQKDALLNGRDLNDADRASSKFDCGESDFFRL